jgi:hypothetical protein
MRLLSSLRPATLVLVGAALLARASLAAASGSASDPGPAVVETVVVVDVATRAETDHEGTADAAYCCPLSGTLPAVGWYARSFRVRSWREFLLPFAGRGDAECP